MKKIFLKDGAQFTYLKNRTCRHCGEPIADQDDLKKEFCEKTYNEFGKVKDCKTAHHRENDKPDRVMHARIINNQKAISTRLEFLIKKKGDQVSTEDLDTYEINLSESLNFKIEKNGTMISQFLNHTIISNPFTEIHKIQYHDK